jgi:lipid A ethanolaminephosphotransferase
MTFTLKQRPVVSHAVFCIAYPAALYLACNALNLDKLAKWFPAGQGVDVWPFCAYLAAGLALFIVVFTLLAHPWTTKPFAWAIAIAASVATYFIRKYDVAIDSSMVQNTLHTDPTEVRQLLSRHMAPYVLGLAGAPGLLVAGLRIRFAPGGRYLLGSLKVAGAALVIAVILLALNFSTIQRAGNVSNKYILYSLVPVDILAGSISVATSSAHGWLAARRASRPIEARVTHPGNLVVVLAIGESSRRANFSSYGYARRNTTPRLSHLQGVHFLDGIAKRGSTINALPQILEKDHVKLPAITQHAGIPTACIVNYSLYDNCAAVGETPVGPCGHAGHCYDEDVIPPLAAKLANYSSGYSFIVLHLGGGSHGPVYRDRHPPEFLRFQPTCDDPDVANRCTVEEIYNSYDNTILYVDHVVATLLQTLDHSGAPYVFLYLSDHGESLLENGLMFHGMPPGVPLPKEQAQIPLIVKSSVPVTLVPRKEYSQPDVFDTVLDLFTIDAPHFDKAGSFVKRTDGR